VEFCNHLWVSYDLDIYTASSVPRAGLIGLVDGMPELTASGGLEGGADSVIVQRGRRRAYCCTVDGPFGVEAEDIPEEVTAVLLGARWLYTVNVEGSAPAGIRHAVRLARHLAEQLDGAVMDRQQDTVWSRSKGRQVSKPARESRISRIEVDWYCQRQHLGPDPAGTFCSEAARLLPEALPRRFGEYEPLQGKFADAGPDGFSAAWHAATGLLFYSGSGPCISGAMPGRRDRWPDQVWRMSLDFHVGPFQDQRWQAALQALFITLADELPAYYATAQVVRGAIWSGRTVYIDGQSESACSLGWQRHWHGLSPIPVWWEWFGSPYRELVRNDLPADATMTTANGLLHEWATQPADRDELASSANRSFPADLLAILAPNPENMRPSPLIRASRIPADLAHKG